MKALIHFARLLFALFVLRSLEIELDGKKKAAEQITDPLVYLHMMSGIELVRRDCERALAEYNALLPVGERRVMQVA